MSRAATLRIVRVCSSDVSGSMRQAYPPNVSTAPGERTKQRGPSHEGEEICHLVEAEDPDTALCGKDVTGWPWNPPWPYCVVCIDIAKSRPGWTEFHS